MLYSAWTEYGDTGCKIVYLTQFLLSSFVPDLVQAVNTTDTTPAFSESSLWREGRLTQGK